VRLPTCPPFFFVTSHCSLLCGRFHDLHSIQKQVQSLHILPYSYVENKGKDSQYNEWDRLPRKGNPRASEYQPLCNDGNAEL